MNLTLYLYPAKDRFQFISEPKESITITINVFVIQIQLWWGIAMIKNSFKIITFKLNFGFQGLFYARVMSVPSSNLVSSLYYIENNLSVS